MAAVYPVTGPVHLTPPPRTPVRLSPRCGPANCWPSSTRTQCCQKSLTLTTKAN
jgi:hypothetical protein